MTNPIAFLPIFAAKKSRRRKIAEAMLPTMIPFSDPTQQVLTGALMADNTVKSEERAEERITAEVVTTMEAAAKRGGLTDEILNANRKVKAVIDRRPELRQTIEVCAKRLFPVSQIKGLHTAVYQSHIKQNQEDDVLEKLKEFSPHLHNILKPDSL